MVADMEEKCQEDLLSDVIIVHNTGRCGSTLFSKIMGAVGNVESISEPDV